MIKTRNRNADRKTDNYPCQQEAHPMTENTLATHENETQTVAKNEESTVSRENFTAPAVDIHEIEDGLVVLADMPGLDKTAIDVAVDNNLLTIKGHVTANGNGDMIHREFQNRSYYRQFTLGNKIDQTKINAEYQFGVLRLTLPFAEEVKPRKIEVKIA
jgi:HSP20 family protein